VNTIGENVANNAIKRARTNTAHLDPTDTRLGQSDGNDASQSEYLHYEAPGMHRTRAQLLAEIRTLSDEDYVSSRHAAAWLGTSPAQLSNWRYQKLGPKFTRGRARFVRYRISDLQEFMTAREKETE
jgi:hypothetical protein